MRFAGGQMNDFLLRKENFQNIGQQGREERARQIANAFENEALIASTGLKAQATVSAAEAAAEATRAAGAAQGQASMVSGLFGGIGTLAGGFKKPSPTINSYDDIPAAGLFGSDAGAGAGKHAYFGTGGRYGSPTSGSYTDYNLAPW